MSRNLYAILVGLAFSSLTVTSEGGEAPAPPAFTKKPAVTRDGDRVKIEFTVSRETDVAVYIENASGEIIRHLAAGLLGKNPPEPLMAGTLGQSVVWDGKDDDDKKAEGGPFKVRVGLGLSAHYAGMPFNDRSGPNLLGAVVGLAAGPDGRIFVMDDRGAWLQWGGYAVHVFRRDGTYEKTIKPFPSNLPVEKLKATGAFKNDRGYLNPVIFRPHSLTFYPFVDVPARQMAVTSDGRLMLTVAPYYRPGNAPYRGLTAHLAAIDLEGGLPGDRYAGPALGDKLIYQEQDSSAGKDPRLAVSSDGKCVYVVNVGQQAGKAHPAVYRVPLQAMGPASVFFGDKDAPGNDEKHLNGPLGLAADGQGNLLVADYANNRIVVLKEADASFVGSFPVEGPEWVGVHPKTGAIYVHSEKVLKRSGGGVVASAEDSVVKFSGWKDAKEVARLKMPAREGGSYFRGWSFALDGSAEPAVLWVGRGFAGRTPALLRSEDRGAAFGDLAPAGAMVGVLSRNATADPLRRKVFFLVDGQPTLIEEASGKVRRVSVQNGPGTFGGYPSYRLDRDGNYYAAGPGGGLWKCNAEGKFVPFPAWANEPKAKGHLYGTPVKYADRDAGQWHLPGSHGNSGWERDFGVDRRGDIYVMIRGMTYHGLMHVEAYGQDGSSKRTAIYGVSDGYLGPKIDPRGNLYVMAAIKSVGQRFPAELTPSLSDAALVSGYSIKPAQGWNDYLYGSIVKFPPAGGNFLFPADKHLGAPCAEPVKLPDSAAREEIYRSQSKAGGILQGALWYRPGFSPLGEICGQVNGKDDGVMAICHCGGGCDFDVDDFGRVFGPDNGRQRMTVLDTNGNLILHIGAYGNQDYCGPESYVLDPKEAFLRPRKADDPKDLVSPFADPEIGFAWITGLAVTDRHAYVSDALNRRVLRIKLDYAATETVGLP